MQVSHLQDHVTHAVIGGAQMIEMGVSNSAEFFHIMSSTLYKDQILAVVREVLCNAWDAHIEAGCTDKPVEITLTHDKFVVKDFGTGIHHEDIGPIYGVYGHSTKKNDGKQTGGFGLGCKSPFAYTDHFTVVSTNSGLRTIYNISKSNAQAQGKPGIIPIASFPSNESGLQVSIDIKNRVDYNRFMVLVKRIVRNGDMNMTLNGEPMSKLGFDTSKSNYLITPQSGLLEPEAAVMVRYGNVIYPIDPTINLKTDYLQIVNHLNSLSMGGSYRIVFQAPPHSITVQPSREGLSMQEHTIQTLQSIFTGFLDTLKGQFLRVCDGIAEQVVLEAVSAANVCELLSTDISLPTSKQSPTSTDDISDLQTMALRYMACNYPNDLKFRKRDIAFRLREMAKGGLLDRGQSQTFLKAVHEVSTNNGHMAREHSQWLQREVLAPLVTGMVNKGIDHHRLFVYDRQDTHAPRGYHSRDVAPLVPATKAKPKHLFNTLPYLRNIVVLSRSKTDILTRAYREQPFREMGGYQGFLFYHLSPKKAEREAVIAFFKATNMSVVELAVLEAAVPRVVTPKKPAKVGVVSVAATKINKTNIHTGMLADDNAARIEKPEFMVLVSLKNGESTTMFPNWDSQSSRIIAERFGDKGGITNNSATYAKYVKEGAIGVDAYVSTRVFAHMTTSPTIAEYWAFNPDRCIDEYLGYYDSRELAKTVYRTKTLRDSFGLKNNLTKEDEEYLYLYNQIAKWYRYDHSKPTDFKAAEAHLNAIPLDPANADFLKKFKANPLLGVINDSGLVNLLGKDNVDAKLKDKAIDILKTVLNN